MTGAIRGILLDMDGVLLDTEEAMLQSTIRGFADYGAVVSPEDFTPFFGAGSREYLGGVGAKYGIAYSPELHDYMYNKYLEIVDRETVRYPGTPQEIERLFRKGYRLAVSSSAARIKVMANLRAADINPDFITCIITEDDITKNKPDPEIFLKAAQSLGLQPEECLAVEDSINGIKAASAAGIKCIGVRGTYPDSELQKAGAYKLVSHFPSQIRSMTLEEALAADPQELLSWRRLGNRLEITVPGAFEAARDQLHKSGIYYDRIVAEKEGAVYNLYGRRL